MKKIEIFDTTLRDGEQSVGCSMTKEDKIKIAKILDEMRVDVIEAGFAASNQNDYDAIEAISRICNYSTVVSLARCKKEDIDIAYEAIKSAKRKRLHIFIATSDIHMKDKLNKTRSEVEEIVRQSVSYAKTKCDDIEFSLEDATRTDKDFACKIIDIAISCGATVINIPDTVGYMLPDEFEEFIMYIKNNSNINNVTLSVHCHNDLGLATANTVTAIKAGATQVEVTVNGIGERAGNTALEEVVAIIDTKKVYDVETNIDLSKIKMISDMVVQATGSTIQSNKAIVGVNAFKHEAGIHQDGVIKNRQTYEIIDPKKYGIISSNIVIGIHSGKSAIISKMQSLGYDINNYNINNILFSIKEWFSNSIYDRNKNMSDEVFCTIVNENEICKIKVLSRK